MGETEEKEGDSAHGEVSGAEVFHLLEQAGISQATLARLGRVVLTSSGEPVRRDGCDVGLKTRSHVLGGGRQKGSDRRTAGAICPIEDEVDGTEAESHSEYPPRESSSASEADVLGDDDASGGICSIDLGIMDDVSCDEGFELEEIKILLKAVEARQSLPERIFRAARLLSRAALPAGIKTAREARALLMSRARSSGRTKALQAFKSLLHVGLEGDSNAGAVAARLDTTTTFTTTRTPWADGALQGLSARHDDPEAA